MDPVEARELLIDSYEDTGNLSETARRWQTSRLVVRKWVRRYGALGGRRALRIDFADPTAVLTQRRRRSWSR